jgi:site-specific recombinase XerD
MLEELQRRNYSDRTAKTYVRIIRDFAKHFHQPPDKLGPEQIRHYQAYLFHTKKLSASSVSQHVSALRFLFVKTLRRHFLTEYIPFPKSPRRLPMVLDPEEVTRLINSASNLFHRTILMTLYSTAVRRSELCRFKVTDIDSKRMMVRINQGKRRRDREVPLSPKLLEALRIYWRWMKPETYLFPGTVHHRRADVPISSNIIWLACRRQPKQPESPSIFRLTRFVTARPPICLTPGPICGPSRFYSGTPAWNTPSSTCTCPASICTR